VPFNSSGFLFFFTAFCLLFFLSPIEKRWWILLAGSLFFYAFAKPVYLFLLAATIITTWAGGNFVYKAPDMRSRKLRMVSVLLFNLLILVVFKYFGFFNELIGLFDKLIKGNIHFRLPEFLLPVGISFYTFQSIGYLLDVYFKIRKPEPHFGKYAVFVSFFPQILSGPIGRSNQLLPQINTPAKVGWSDVENGIGRFMWGLFKKVVIADRIGVLVDDVYGNVGAHQGMVFWFITFLYAFQLYADFSGYTDMAIGIARICGIKLEENFDFPFISKNVTEFWRRWHLSLSNWLRDYLYTPILFSKKKWGKKAVIYAIFLTFLICGLWHGAKLTFVIFGILQGMLLTWDMLTRDKRLVLMKKIPLKLYMFFSWALTFVFISFCFIFFRAETTPDALLVVKREFTTFTAIGDFKNFILQQNGSRVIFSLLLVALFFMSDKRMTKLFREETPTQANLRSVMWGILFALVLVFGTFGKANFIYFKF
jgi:D-alanyl-lipoteichoic acid acyltransferase DltB (MBOAT superfamily)